MSDPQVWLDRLARATNDHDLDALVACFADDYENEVPAHPARGFRGRDQVRRNWEQIFAFVPDLRADVRTAVFDGSMAWTEWDMRGTRRDDSAHHMAGVIVFEVVDGVGRSARFFLEPVEETTGTVDDAVRSQVVRG
jgi:ketosteroid isomerase-like protein